MTMQATVPADRHAAEDELRLLLAAMDAIDSRMCLLDREGRILLANESWRELAVSKGWSQNASGPGADLFPLLADLGHDLMELVRGAVAQVQQDGGPESTSVKGAAVVAGDEEQVVIRVTRVHGHESAASMIRIVNITEPAREEQKREVVTAEATMLALVARHMEHGVLICDVPDTVAWMNDAWTRLTGDQLSELQGRSVSNCALIAGRDPQDSARTRAQVDSGKPMELMAQTTTIDGELRDVHVEITPLLVEDMPPRMITVIRDVTRTLAAERALSAEKTLLSDVLGSIPQLVYWKDAELRYAGANRAFLDIRGLAGLDDVIGRSEELLGCDDSVARALPVMEARAIAQRERVDERITVNLPDERVLHLLAAVLPQLDHETGEVTGVIGVATDVTQVSALEHQLAQGSRLESIGQLAAGVAHEINTPVQYVADNTQFLDSSVNEVLNALRSVEQLSMGEDATAAALREIIGGLDLDFMAEEMPAALQQSAEGLDRVAKIVRAMKDFSHPGEGRTAADLNRAIESTAQVSRNEWRYIADLELDLGPDVGMVRCYEGELKQVLLNMVVNAAQAIAEQEENAGTERRGRITARTRRDGDSVTITIEDDGPGMPESVKQRIFDPFFTTKPVGKGTGQGLSIAYACIVTKHGGTLTVDSEVGRGTSFTMVLPDIADHAAE